MEHEDLYKRILDFIRSFSGKTATKEERVESAIALALMLLELIQLETTKEERFREEKVARMMEDPKGKAFVTAMTDQFFRSSNARKRASMLIALLNKYGVPRFLPQTERFKLYLFKYMGLIVPELFVALAKKQIQKEAEPVLLPLDHHSMQAYIEQAKKEKIKVNLNHLGEAILGEKEAVDRLGLYLQDLKNPAIDHISIKISTLYSQITPIAWDEVLEILSERLAVLYRAAMDNLTGKHKFVNLDMEEYKDLDLTVALFKKVLEQKEFHPLKAGIVLQSYLPDSFDKLKELTEFAMDRFARGGSPIKIRIVKGANLAMERVESSLRGWEQAPFTKKVEADANFRRMLDFACQSNRAQAVNIGVGSHNLFDIAYALILRSERDCVDEISFEMLKGMNDPMRRVVHKIASGILLYSPATTEENFQFAIAYLIRRLDENTGKDNFLRHIFGLSAHTATWEEQAEFFREGFKDYEALHEKKRRKQNRLLAEPPKERSAPFSNEPDTDFSLKENREFAANILHRWKNKKHEDIPLVIGGEEIFVNLAEGADPSRPSQTLYKYASADIPLIDKAMDCAKKWESKWGATPHAERLELLGKVADILRNKRGDLIGSMIADTGKIIAEADAEISEAIDFIEYYRKNWEELLSFSEIHFKPKGTILITPPWNFPSSIPCGGISAALIAGNCVIFKPAPESVLVGFTLVSAFWEAGIPKEVLQFINCPDEPVGSALIKDPRINSVILTGGTATARLFLKLRPGLNLIAEAGGKNFLIISSLCDRDLAIKDLLHSAFGFGGQKCSACSMALIESSLYQDEKFLASLKDAAESLAVGSAWDPITKIGPLIRPPEGPLRRGISELEPKERWLLMPKNLKNNPYLWTPGIKLAVAEGSFTHQTELFGPVLGLMPYNTLEEAIEIANATPYGLTSGLHSLDEREQKLWIKKIRAGNLYINRTITGAIVKRQPFGGCKASCFGPGGKAGGPNYVLQCASLSQKSLPIDESETIPSDIQKLIQAFPFSFEEKAFLLSAAKSYAKWSPILLKPTPVSKIIGQENLFYHVPLDDVMLIVSEEDNLSHALAVIIACYFCKTPLTLSTHHSKLISRQKHLPVKLLIETAEAYPNSLATGRMRLLHAPDERLKKIGAEKGIHLIDAPVLATGRFELLHYLREVSLSHDTHRYGYLPEE